MSDFKRRFESLITALYPISPPGMAVGEDRASIRASAGEIWATFGNFDRLTRLVLSSHRFRLGASISSDSGFTLRITSLGYHPDNQTEHHPGLGDLVAAAYRMGGKQSDAELLAQSREIIDSLLLAPGVDPDQRERASRFLQESKR